MRYTNKDIQFLEVEADRTLREANMAYKILLAHYDNVRLYFEWKDLMLANSKAERELLWAEFERHPWHSKLTVAFPIFRIECWNIWMHWKFFLMGVKIRIRTW